MVILSLSMLATNGSCLQLRAKMTNKLGGETKTDKEVDAVTYCLSSKCLFLPPPPFLIRLPYSCSFCLFDGTKNSANQIFIFLLHQICSIKS